MGNYLRSYLQSRRLAYLLLGLIALALYFLIFFNGFVDDDIAQVVSDPSVHHLSGLLWSFRSAAGFYRPLMFVYFTLVYSIFGSGAFWFHFFEVILAICNALLVLWLFRQFLSRRLSFLLTLIFVVSPLNIDAVAFISHIQDILFLFFGLLSIRLLNTKLQTNLKFGLIGLALVCAYLSKEVGFLFIALDLIYCFCFSKGYLKPLSLCIVASLVIYGIIRWVSPVEVIPPTIAPIATLDLAHRLLQIPSIIWFYLSNFIYPHNLSISRLNIVTEISLSNFWLPLLFELSLLGVLVRFGVWLRNKRPKLWPSYLFFGLWLIIALAAHLQIVTIKDGTVADWWFYLPMIALLGLVGVIISSMRPIKSSQLKVVLWGIFGLWVIFLGWQAIGREINFHSEMSLLSHDEAVNQSSYLLEDEFGQQLLQSGQYQPAISHFYRSVSLSSHHTTAWNDLGVTYDRLGQSDLAEEYFQDSINNSPATTEAYYNLALLLLENLDTAPAQNFLSSATARYPKDPFLQILQGQLYLKLGDNTAATADDNRARVDAKALGIPIDISNNLSGQTVELGGSER